ncbi:MAG: DUF192 domain-containing protein [Planctomycetota bacterium]
MIILVAVVAAFVIVGAPSIIPGCENGKPRTPKPQPGALPTHTKVTVGGKVFTLELALEQAKRFKGLSGRTEIPADGGMLFVLPFPAQQTFVMRDCPVDIDIIYLDPTMKITAWHEMKAGPVRTEAQKVLDARGVNQEYEDLLFKYSSKFAAQYVIELKGGTIAPMGLKEGQKIEIDPALKLMCK